MYYALAGLVVSSLLIIASSVWLTRHLNAYRSQLELSESKNEWYDNLIKDIEKTAFMESERAEEMRRINLKLQDRYSIVTLEEFDALKLRLEEERAKYVDLEKLSKSRYEAMVKLEHTVRELRGNM